MICLRRTFEGTWRGHLASFAGDVILLQPQKPIYSSTPPKTQKVMTVNKSNNKMMKCPNKKHSPQRKVFLFLLEQRLGRSDVFPMVSFEEGDALIGSC